MYARFAFDGSTAICVTSRRGAFAAVLSSRVYVTDEAGAFELSLISTRPVIVAAHSVPSFCEARVSAPTRSPGTASAPYAVPVMSVAPGGPIRWGSPHVGGVTAVF